MAKQEDVAASKSKKITQSISSDLSPSKILDLSDPGDETQRRFRYQHAYGIILLTAAICSKKPYIAVWCEHHEDLLGERPDGYYDGYQIKTQQPNYGLWDLTKEPLKASIKRFVELDLRFPNKIKELFFVSNIGYEKSAAKTKVGSSPIKLLQAIQQVDSLADLAPPFDEAFDKLRAYCDCSPSDLKATLQKLNLVQGPDLDSFETVIAHEHLPQIPVCSTFSSVALATLRDELIAKVYRASSLSSDDPRRHWASIQGNDHLNPKLIAKRIPIESIIKYIKNNRQRLINMVDDIDFLDEQSEETLFLYLSKSFNEDKVAKLDQAGETDSDRSTLLRQVFVDLDIKPREGPSPHIIKYNQLKILDEVEQASEISVADQGKILSAMHCFLQEPWPKIVLIGGPGQGKSTLGQYLAQVHRGMLLEQENELYQNVSDHAKKFKPKTPRVPFRIVLKYFAQWLSDGPTLGTVEAYIAEQINKGASRPGEISVPKVQEILKHHPSLIIFDGLDEVTEPELRNRVLDQVEEFLERAGRLEVDIQVLATTRPTGYNNQFSPEQFWHIELQPMSVAKVKDYAIRWTNAKVGIEEERRRVKDTLQECLQEDHTRWLLTTPLQVTIVLLIIKDGGRPPAQREALFQNYWTTILRREKSKAKGIIRTDDALLFNLHAYLGYLLHRKSGGENVRSLLSTEDFERLVFNFLRTNDRVSSQESLKQLTAQMVEEARYRLVLLVEPEPSLFGFELRSLQEFFAGAYLVQSATDTQQRFERLKAIARSEHWRNVALFFTGRIVRDFGGEAANILELVCRPIDREAPDYYLRRGAFLALDIAADGVFAANRNLQYNALEYALTVLNTGMRSKDWSHLQSTLKKLPTEDYRDILSKLLKQMGTSLPLSRLNVLLNLYEKSSVIPQDLMQGLDTLLFSNQPQQIQAALNLGFLHKIDTKQLARQLDIYWHIWTSKNYISSLQTWWRADPQYILKVLIDLPLSRDKASQLLKEVTASYFFSETFKLFELPNTISEQIFTYLHCEDDFYYLLFDSSINTKKIRFKGGLDFNFFDLEKTYKKRDSLIHNSKLILSLGNLLNRSDLLPQLRLHAWKLYLALNGVDDIVFSKLINDTIWRDNDLNDLNLFIIQIGHIWPLLSLILKSKIQNAQESLSAFQPSLRSKEQEILINQQAYLILQNLSQILSDEEAIDFALHICMEEEIRLGELTPIAEQLEINVSELIATYSYINLTGRRKIPSAFLKGMFSKIGLHLAEPQKIQNTILTFCYKEWSLDQETLKQGRELLTTLIEKSPQQRVALQVAICLFLKLLAVDLSVLQLGLQLFPLLASFEEILPKDYYFWISTLIVEIPYKHLTELANFITNEDELIRRGAFIFWESVILEYYSRGERRLERSRKTKFKNLRFNWQLSLSSLKETKTSYRKQGITLLTFSDFPITDKRYQTELFDAITKTQDQGEIRAWSFFMAHIPISISKKNRWLEFLETILDHPQLFVPEILNAAMERYAALIGDVGPMMIGDNAALGLPTV